MTNNECADHLERLKLGIRIINSLIPEEDSEDRDMIDIEALNHAIAVLRGDDTEDINLAGEYDENLR